MDAVTRRQFLKASGVGGGIAALSATGLASWSQLQSRAASTPLPAGARVLVLVTLYGGNDGLGTVIPYADPALRAARPELTYDEQDVLHLDGELGLNPAMKGLHQLWKDEGLAVVRGVGYPKPDHSHFRSMDIWQTASPDEPVSTGWIGRWLDSTGSDPLRAVSVGSVLPPLAVGRTSTAAALPVGGAQALAPDLAQAVAALGRPDRADTPHQALVAGSFAAERRVASTFDPVRASGGSAGAGDEDLAAQLQLVAACVKAGVPTRCYSVSLGGFDTHADEKQTQSALLGTLDSALSTFLADLAKDPHGRGVVVMAYSEFGRRVHANGSDGTDHGTASPVLVAGVPVKGGFYGDQPSLTDLDQGDLKTTTDFRDVYGELLDKVLGADPQRILGTRTRPVGFLA
ncbi:MAG: DUF1501 domain-containing protein [Nocardioidaceae bacterium]